MNTTTSARLAHLYDALTGGIVSGHTVALPNAHHERLSNASVRWCDAGILINGPGFKVSLTEDEADHIEGRLNIAVEGADSLSAWLDVVEAAHYPSALLTGSLPIIAWSSPPPPDWESCTITDTDSQERLERAALEAATGRWGYQTCPMLNADGTTSRTYHFECAADAVYARLAA